MVLGEIIEKFKSLFIAGGIATGVAAGAIGGYHYYPVENTQEDLGDPSKFRYSPTSSIKGIFIHHVAGDMTPREIDDMHQDMFNSGGISYTNFFDNGRTYYTSPWDLKKAQASKMNTVSRGLVFNGNYEVEEPSEEDLAQFEIQLFSILRVFPHIEWVRPHNLNIYSKTLCPGKYLEEELRKRVLFFESRAEIDQWLRKMEMRLLNPCMDERLEDIFIDGEPC